MDLQKLWEKALEKTEVVRPRVAPLEAFSQTKLPYIFLSEPESDENGTLVRKGEILVEKPSIILPSDLPQFQGFEAAGDLPVGSDFFSNFLLIRGVRFPSWRYQNHTISFTVYDGGLQKAIDHFRDQLQRSENTSTGLVIGPESCWQLSVLIFTGLQVIRSAEGDIRALMEKYRREEDESGGHERGPRE